MAQFIKIIKTVQIVGTKSCAFSFRTFRSSLNNIALICVECVFAGLCMGNSMICSDISRLSEVISRAVRRGKIEIILKYHEWYLCQISRTNHAIICLYYYPPEVCDFHL